MLLNGKTLNVVILNGGPGRVVLKPVTASTTSTATFGPFRFGKLISYVATTTATVTNSVRKTFTYLSTSSKNLVTGLVRGKVLTTTIQNSVSSIVRQILANKTIVSTSTASIIKRIATSLSILSTNISTITNSTKKVLTYLSTSSASLIRAVNKLITVSVVSTTKIIKLIYKSIITDVDYILLVLTDFAIHLVAISYLTASTFSITKTINKVVNVTESTIVSILKQVATIKTIVSTSLATLNKIVNKIITVTVINIANVFKKIVKTIPTIITTILTTFTKSIAKILSYVTSSSLSTLKRSVLKIVQINTYVLVVLEYIKEILLELSCLVNSVSKVIKSVGKIRFARTIFGTLKLTSSFIAVFISVPKFKVYYPLKNRLISLAHTNLIFVNNFKNRLIYLVKNTSVEKTKDLNG
jgi:hypothetical protein